MINKPLYVIVSGSRDWKDLDKIEEEIKKLPKNTIIVEGAERGAERCAAYVAVCNKYRVREYPADWDLLGQNAGRLRNEHMLEKHPISSALIFHKNFQNSKGRTKLLTDLLQKEEIPYIVFS